MGIDCAAHLDRFGARLHFSQCRDSISVEHGNVQPEGGAERHNVTSQAAPIHGDVLRMFAAHLPSLYSEFVAGHGLADRALKMSLARVSDAGEVLARQASRSD